MRSDSLTVMTPLGGVRGLVRDTDIVFYGVPYAEAPVGDARFQAPRDRSSWEGVRDATKPGATAQFIDEGPGGATVILGDDYLNAVVFAPLDFDESTACPVIVWIHGGSFIAGGPAVPYCDGAKFAEQGIVFVSISYRLGFDGFGYVEGSDAPINRGILDSVCALRWVRENIASFGGNPDQVTIMGESAGAGIVMAMMAMPLAEGLFRRVISMSSPSFQLSLEDVKADSIATASRLGVAATLAGFQSISRVEVEKNRSPKAKKFNIPTLATALRMMGNAKAEMKFGPVLDGDVVPMSLSESASNLRSTDIELLIGATRDEAVLLPGLYRWLLNRRSQVAALRQFGLTDAQIRGYLEVRGADCPSTFEIVQAAFADLVFQRTIPMVVDRRVSVDAAPSWVYRFDWVSSATGFASHAVDIPFALHSTQGNLDPFIGKGKTIPQQLVDDFHGAVVAFVRGEGPGWDAVTAERQTVQVFNTPRSRPQQDLFASARIQLQD